jgi:hypothetical protein
MRWIGWVLLAIVLAGYLAAEMPPPATPQPAPADTLWRRTRDGWQHATWLLPAESIPSRRPALHPVVVGMLEILLSAAALIAFSDGGAAGIRRNNGSTYLA